MLIRYSKILLSAASAFFLLLVVFNNITDYGSNLLFVENVLGMTTTFEGNAAMWRAVDSPVIHHLFYAGIIIWEAVACVIIGIGTWKLFKARSAAAAVWQKAKSFTLFGHTVSLLQWYIAFLTVGAEWFLMWQSEEWNGQDAAHRMFVVMGIILIFIFMKDDELESSEA